MSTESLIDVPLIDHHCHGVAPHDQQWNEFEDGLSEAFAPAPAGTTHWDKPVGLSIRRWCPPLLDLEKFCAPEAYVARRLELGAEEVNRRFMRASGFEALLIDTGNNPERLLGVEGMAEVSACPAHEVVRLESIAEAVACGGVSAEGFADGFDAALRAAAANAVGLKSILAYRATLMVELTAPGKAEVAEAAGRWLAEIEKSGTARITDPVLERHLVWSGIELARERGFPIQFHIGVGDPDITLNRCDPSHLTPFFIATEPLGVNFTLLHCYPFHREAGLLSENFPHVYFDVGFVLNWAGPSYARILGEALELVPFTKQLYSSDAYAHAELYYLGALRFRMALKFHLDRWIREDECIAADADRIVEYISRQNSRRIYPLPGASA
jgi:predicted TIM-barrel fold metal-dependent hydrolase